MSKIKPLGLIAVLLSSFAYMADLAITPAGDAIFAYYAGQPMWILNFILTGTQLIAIASSLLAPVAMRYFSKKNILVVSFAIFTFASCLGAVNDNVVYVAVMRGIVGLGLGATFPVDMAIIQEAFSNDETKCATYTGMYNCIMTVLGAALSIVAGFVSLAGWQNVYAEYLVAIPILVLIIIAVPQTPPERERTSAARQEEPADGKYAKGALVFGLIALLAACVLFSTISYEISFYVTEVGLGDSTVSGFMTLAVTLGTAVSAGLFGALYKRLKGWTGMLFFLLYVVSYVFFSIVAGNVWCAIACFLIGFANGLSAMYFFMYIPSLMPASKNSLAMGLVATFTGIGAFICSYILTFVQGATGIEQIVALCPWYALVAVPFTIVFAVIALRGRSKRGNEVVRQTVANEE